jgi:uncharacterized protein YecE (DUF72 family)
MNQIKVGCCGFAKGRKEYFRLHGGSDYRHQYTNDELTKLSKMIDEEAYVLFNNIAMYNDALKFKGLVGVK